MWTVRTASELGGRGLRATFRIDGRPALYSDVVLGWQHDGDCRSAFLDLLASAPYRAYFWETPPVSSGTERRPFECVLLDAPELDRRRADPSPFAEHLRNVDGDGVVVFPSLGGDALLVVPVALTRPSTYAHLAVFARGAPESQRHTLLGRLGAALASRLAERPTWVSTSGLGVAWLHVRLDERPKYYQYAAYRLDP